jgi:hypothetical protein
MRRVMPFALMSLALFVGAVAVRGADEKAKYTIKEVMKEQGKGKLRDKVIDGTASDDDKKKLVEMYEALPKNSPPRGDKDNWKKLTDALIKAAKDAKEGKDGAVDALKKASNCMACHKDHKPT